MEESIEGKQEWRGYRQGRAQVPLLLQHRLTGTRPKGPSTDQWLPGELIGSDR